MSVPALTPEALAELALDYARPWEYRDGRVQVPRELPLFVNGCGPLLLRQAPLRLLPISMRTAYAMARAGTSSLTWPAYDPSRDWVVRATSYHFNGY